jgi:phage antirepressor YoqD-like protein
MKKYSTATVARTIGIGKRTLLRWLYEKKIAEPKRLTEGGQDIRLWTERDVERVSRYKEANYRKGRGRKKKPS